MSQVPAARTVCSPREFAHAFIVAWRALYGRDPGKDQCGVLYAQWIVETGGAACWCWNIGNVKVTPAQVLAGVPWFDLAGTWEIIGGKRVVLPEGHAGRRFRAYSSLSEAMPAHLAFLRNDRYRPSWPFVEAGDPDGFARALKRQGYYTASADDYARIMVSAFGRWMQSSTFDDALDAAPPAPASDTEPPSRIVDFDIVTRLPGDDEPPPEAA